MFVSTSFIRQLKLSTSKRFSSLLKEIMSRKIPAWQRKITELKTQYGEKEVSKINLGQVLRGMEGLSSMFYSPVVLNPKTGVTYRGYSIEEITEYLPKALEGPHEEGDEPLPEALFWLLVTGDFPTPHEHGEISMELRRRGRLDKEIKEYIQQFPKEMHPMTQLSSVMLYLQPTSLYQRAISENITESQLWQYGFEDSLNLLAKLPYIAAYIYRHKYKNDIFVDGNEDLDWAGNLVQMMGFQEYEFREFMRMHLSLHAGMDGGDVSTLTSHLLGTAHVDPYLAYSAAINAMSGPLSGSSSKETLKWLLKMNQALGDNPEEANIKDYIMNYLTENPKIPGYGHSLLTHVDSRFIQNKLFVEKYIRKDPLISLCQKCYKVVPGLLKSMQKEKNPWPTVDAISGAVLYHYGLKEEEFFMVLDAVARALGCMANIVVTNALQIGSEKQISIHFDWLENKLDAESNEEKS